MLSPSSSGCDPKRTCVVVAAISAYCADIEINSGLTIGAGGFVISDGDTAASLRLRTGRCDAEGLLRAKLNFFSMRRNS